MLTERLMRGGYMVETVFYDVWDIENEWGSRSSRCDNVCLCEKYTCGEVSWRGTILSWKKRLRKVACLTRSM